MEPKIHKKKCCTPPQRKIPPGKKRPAKSEPVVPESGILLHLDMLCESIEATEEMNPKNEHTRNLKPDHITQGLGNVEERF